MDPYADLLYSNYTDNEIAEMPRLMESWDKTTYLTFSNSIVKHAKKYGFEGDYLCYL